MSGRSYRGALFALAVASVGLACAAPAHASFPGANGILSWSQGGKIWGSDAGVGTPRVIVEVPGLDIRTADWSADGERVVFEARVNGNPRSIWVANADGTGATQLTPGPFDRTPAWSPDGQRIVFSAPSATSDRDLWVMDADGSDVTQLTFTPGTELDPDWSPDGERIAYTYQVGGEEVWTIRPDGTDATFVHAGFSPDWSPFGDELVLRFPSPDERIYRIPLDGSSATPLTSISGLGPVFSPDGSRVAFETCCPDVFTTGYNGGTPVGVGPSGPLRTLPAWQTLPAQVAQPYPRPKGATPVRVPLVPAFASCDSPDRVHGPPLAFGSCSGPQQTSSTATVGTPDANGAAANFEGAVRYAVVVGNPSTPADEADVSVTAEISDVRLRAGNGDYPVPLEIVFFVSITERDPVNGSLTLTTPAPNTTAFYEWPLRVPVPCATNSDPSVGSTCSVSTTLDAVLPGSVPERRRSVWGLDQIRVFDSGGDGQVSTTDDNEQFAVQGLFVP